MNRTKSTLNQARGFQGPTGVAARIALSAGGLGLMAASALAQSAIYSNVRTSVSEPGLATGATTVSGVAAPQGLVWSEAQAVAAGEASGVAGFAGFAGGTAGALGAANYRFADDFTVGAGRWRVDRVILYAYVLGASGGDPFSGASLRVWDGGVPGAAGASVIWGAPDVNILAAQTQTNVLRTFSTAAVTGAPAAGVPDSSRRVWAVELALGSGLTLQAGRTYWMDWQLDTAADGQAFVPPITVVGQRTRPGLPLANALQYRTAAPPVLAGAWLGVIDGGKPAQSAPDVAQELPFVLIGAVLPAACGASDIAGPGPVAGADGELTADDVILFVSWFTLSDVRADVASPGPAAGADGEFTADDIILFINRFTTGC